MDNRTKKIIKENFDNTEKDIIKNVNGKEWICYTLYKYTPAGEDWSIQIVIDEEPEFKEKLIDFCKNYDKNEELKMWVKEGGNVEGVPEIDELIEDAKWKESFLESILKKLKNYKTMNEAQFFSKDKEKKQQLLNLFDQISEIFKTAKISLKILKTPYGDKVKITCKNKKQVKTERILDYNPCCETWINFINKIKAYVIDAMTVYTKIES